MTLQKNWQKHSWRNKPIKQQPSYQDKQALDLVLKRIERYPPLVFVGEVDRLKNYLAEAADGRCFVLQGGDCAERFQDCNQEAIPAKLRVLLQMSVVLCYGARKPVVRIGRIAGQYAKPRSSDFETIDDVQIPSFRGDNVNGYPATAESRIADPNRLEQSYHCASMTLNYIRALIKGGWADLHHPENWDTSFFAKATLRRRYEDIVAHISRAISFMESLGGVSQETLGSVDFFTSHEGLILALEESLTRIVGSKAYNLGAHMLWIGDRTRQLDGAHVEYFRGIANPVGVKIGPSCPPDELVELIEHLNPEGEKGRLTLISRFGHEKVAEFLPPMIRAVQKCGIPVLWSCDPMHGNAIKTKDGTKTRNFSSILEELEKSFAIHAAHNSRLGGVHFELTGENVTECIGGSEAIEEKDLSRYYESFCDPRLNYSQSLEMAFLIATILQESQI